ncbi:MAG: methylated-DNA--[protein]-cysteine S-methyltransferase [Xanthomonadales bacterium]|nr:methylated-DNA--[protein]-cysteine S-methyltransferase [Xanthomonadales bacterium]
MTWQPLAGGEYWHEVLESPLGPLVLVATRDGLDAIRFARNGQPDLPADSMHAPGRLAGYVQQLQEYFAGTREAFELPLAPRGTAFQLLAWRALGSIPFGETRSYADQARAIGRPKAVRAVGAANGANPIPIVIPCHRVIGSDGSLTGFGGGLDAKRWLLGFESRQRSLL